MTISGIWKYVYTSIRPGQAVQPHAAGVDVHAELVAAATP